MKFTIDGVTHEMLRLNDLTFEEGRLLEKQVGHPFQRLIAEPELQGSITYTQAMLWLSIRRSEPEFTFFELDGLSMGAIETHDDEAEPEGGEAPPTGSDEETTSADDA